MSSKPMPKRVKDLPPIDFDSDNSSESEEKSITEILQTIINQRGHQRRNTLMPKRVQELSQIECDSTENLSRDVDHVPENCAVDPESTIPCITTPAPKKCPEREEKVILSVDYKKHLKENNMNLANMSIKPCQKFSSESSKSSTMEMKSNNSVPNKIPDVKSAHKIVQINGKDYNVIRKLGHGGSSVVYLAQTMDCQECALKVVRLNGDENALCDNMNEIKLLRKLQGTSIVKLFDHFYSREDSILYIVMEKGEQDLSSILKEFTNNLPLYTIMDFWYQMLQCVKYIHECGVIHCDIKPANFLMINGKLKLIDFGIASNISLDSTSIIKHTQAGTYNYISPEALIDISTDAEGSLPNTPKIKISPKTDVWSLGCIFFQFMYKTTPFASIKNIINKIMAICDPNTSIDYPPLPSIYPSMFLEIAQKCLKHNPKERISIKDLLEYPFDMFIQSK